MYFIYISIFWEMVTAHPVTMQAGTVKEPLTEKHVCYCAGLRNNAALLHMLTMVKGNHAVVTTARVVAWILQITTKKLMKPTERNSMHKVYISIFCYNHTHWLP